MCRYTIAIATMGDGKAVDWVEHGGEPNSKKSSVEMPVLKFHMSSIAKSTRNLRHSRHHVIPRPTPPQTATAASRAASAYCIMHLDFQQTEHKFCFASSASYSTKMSSSAKRKGESSLLLFQAPPPSPAALLARAVSLSDFPSAAPQPP
jgi:hypothetical protein